MLRVYSYEAKGYFELKGMIFRERRHPQAASTPHDIARLEVVACPTGTPRSRDRRTTC